MNHAPFLFGILAGFSLGCCTVGALGFWCAYKEALAGERAEKRVAELEGKL